MLHPFTQQLDIHPVIDVFVHSKYVKLNLETVTPQSAQDGPYPHL